MQRAILGHWREAAFTGIEERAAMIASASVLATSRAMRSPNYAGQRRPSAVAARSAGDAEDTEEAIVSELEYDWSSDPSLVDLIERDADAAPTAEQPDWLGRLETAALTLDPRSPWVCWRHPPFVWHSAILAGDKVTHRLGAAGEKARVALAAALNNDGVETSSEQVERGGEVVAFTLPASPNDTLDVPRRYRRLANVPDWLVDLVASQLDNHDSQHRVIDFFAALTLRSGLPRRLLEDAARVAVFAKTSKKRSSSRLVGLNA